MAHFESSSSKRNCAENTDIKLLFLYNSSSRNEDIFWGRGDRRTLYDVCYSEDEKRKLELAGKQMERSLRALAREHKAV